MSAPRNENAGYAYGNMELMMAGERRSTFIWKTSSDVICYLLLFLAYYRT